MDPLAVIETESARFARVLAAADPAARVPTCPDWDARDLLWHLTEVQLFWAAVLERDIRSDDGVAGVEAGKPDRPQDLSGLLALRERATAALLEQLGGLDDAQPRWSWWEPDQTVGFTRRMQTYEATMHRVDAELTAGVPVEPLSDEVAAGAVDHAVDVMWGWMPDWADYRPLAQVRFAATDTGSDWQVEVGHWTGTGPESGNHFDEPRGVRSSGDAPAAAEVSGTVADLALWAWTRGGRVTVDGTDPARAALDRLLEQGMP